MEFTVTHQKSTGRIGMFQLPSLDEIHRGSNGVDCTDQLGFDRRPNASAHQNSSSDFKIETPNTIVYTRYGRIPHLTADVEQSLSGQKSPELKKMRLSELMEESLSKSLYSSKKGYKNLTNAQESAIFFCSVHDSYKDTSKFAEEKTVSVWTNSGRRKVTPEEYMEALSISEVPLAEALSCVTSVGASSKQIKKSVDRTLKHLDRCIELKQSNQGKYRTNLFGAIVGGDVIKERIRSAQETAKRNVEGFVLEGFDRVGDKFYDVLQETMKFLPNEKIKILLGIFRPDQIIDAVSLGVDLVDNSYSFDAMSRDSALVFEFSRKKRKMREMYPKSPTSLKAVGEPNAGFEICLKETRFKEDFRPIIEGCNCYTCLKYSRAYLNHLLITNEMLAQVLLMVHNTHHFDSFMYEVRKAVSEETLSCLKDQLGNAKT